MGSLLNNNVPEGRSVDLYLTVFTSQSCTEFTFQSFIFELEDEIKVIYLLYKYGKMNGVPKQCH